MSCWELLKEEDKWVAFENRKEATTESSGTSSQQSLPTTSQERPMGTKKAKALASEKAKSNEVFNKISERLSNLIDDVSDLVGASMLPVDLSAVSDPRIKRFYEEKNEEFLNRWEAKRNEGSFKRRRLIEEDIETEDGYGSEDGSGGIPIDEEASEGNVTANEEEFFSDNNIL